MVQENAIPLNGIRELKETLEVFTDIYNERINQTAKWGKEVKLINRFGARAYLDRKMSVLIEEVGEFAKEVNDKRLDEMYNEAIQAAAVMVAICEGIELIRNGEE